MANKVDQPDPNWKAFHAKDSRVNTQYLHCSPADAFTECCVMAYRGSAEMSRRPMAVHTGLVADYHRNK